MKRGCSQGGCSAVAALHEKLYELGLAVRLGEPFPGAPGRPPDDLPRVVARIRELT